MPEVDKRQLYKKYKFYSVYEFAVVLGGVSHKTVEEVLRVHRKIEDKSLLQAEISEKGWAKVRAVTPLLDTVDEKDLVNMVQTMPRRAIEVAVREIKRQEGFGEENVSGGGFEWSDNFEIPTGWGKEMALESQSVLSFKVDNEVEFQLRKIKQAMEKERKEVVSFNNVLKGLLGMAEMNKNEKGRELVDDKKLTVDSSVVQAQDVNSLKSQLHKELLKYMGIKSLNKATTRHIPVAKRREINKKYKGKCSYPNCHYLQDVVHHQERFALKNDHEKIVPLCKTHHDIVHAGLVENENQMPEVWQITARVDRDSLNYGVDKKFQKLQMRF